MHCFSLFCSEETPSKTIFLWFGFFFFNSYSCLCNQPVQQPFILFYIVDKAYRNTSKLYALNCNSSKSTAVKMANSNLLNFWTVKTYRKAELWITTLTKIASFFFYFSDFPWKRCSQWRFKYLEVTCTCDFNWWRWERFLQVLNTKYLFYSSHAPEHSVLYVPYELCITGNSHSSHLSCW